MRLKYVLLTALLGTAAPALAQVTDHLTPPPDGLLQPNELVAYRATVGRRLGRGLVRRPLVQVVVYPSFEPEYLLSVECTGINAYTLLYRRAQRNIWYASPHKLPANVALIDSHGARMAPPKPVAAPDSIPLTTYQVALQPRLAQALTDLFNVALAQARYPSEPVTYIDGTLFTFIACGAQGYYRSGDTHSAAQGTHLKQLLNLVKGLQELITNPENRDFVQGVLFQDAQALLYELAAR